MANTAVNPATSQTASADSGPAFQADASLGYFRSNLRRKLEQNIPGFNREWSTFAQSWDALARDEFMGDGGHYRYRRYAVFSDAADGSLTRLDEQRHYQARHYNGLNGGIYREYPCFEPSTLESPVFGALLDCAWQSVRAARPDVESWRFEAHQFRILASKEERGKPVPEGIHQDGVDYVFVFLVDRVNVRGGVSRVYKPDGHQMAELKLRHPLDFMVINDRTVFHYVTPIHPRDEVKPSHRDVLVITVRGLNQKAVERAA